MRGKGDWTPVSSTPTKDPHFKVPNLVEGAELEFRVVAVNDAGPGKPSKSTGPHKVRDPICKSWSSHGHKYTIFFGIYTNLICSVLRVYYCYFCNYFICSIICEKIRNKCI